MNEILINIAEDGYSEGLQLSNEAIVRGYELGLFTKEEFEKNPDFYNEVPRHHPLLIQIYNELKTYISDDIYTFDPTIVSIDSDTYSIIEDKDGSEKLIEQNDKSFNWIKI